MTTLPARLKLHVVVCLAVIFAFRAPSSPSHSPSSNPIDSLIRACAVYNTAAMQRAVDRLIDLGHPELPRVLTLLKHTDANVRWQAVRVVDGISVTSPSIQRQLVASCDDTDADVRAEAILTLAHLSPTDPDSVTCFRQATEDFYPMVQANAWMATWMAKPNTNAIHQLIHLLASKNWMASEKASLHLVTIGTPALPHIIHAATNPSFARRSVAISTLGKARAPSAIPTLRTLANQPSTEEGQTAFNALATIGPPAIPTLLEFLTSSNRTTIEPTIRSLGKIGPRAIDAIPHLTPFLDQPAHQVSTVTAIGQIRNATDESLRRLIELLESENPDLRAATARTLGQLPRIPQHATRSLRHLATNDPKDYIRQAARESLDLGEEKNISSLRSGQ